MGEEGGGADAMMRVYAAEVREFACAEDPRWWYVENFARDDDGTWRLCVRQTIGGLSWRHVRAPQRVICDLPPVEIAKHRRALMEVMP